MQLISLEIVQTALQEYLDRHWVSRRSLPTRFHVRAWGRVKTVRGLLQILWDCQDPLPATGAALLDLPAETANYAQAARLVAEVLEEEQLYRRMVRYGKAFGLPIPRGGTSNEGFLQAFDALIEHQLTVPLDERVVRFDKAIEAFAYPPGGIPAPPSDLPGLDLGHAYYEHGFDAGLHDLSVDVTLSLLSPAMRELLSAPGLAEACRIGHRAGQQWRAQSLEMDRPHLRALRIKHWLETGQRRGNLFEIA